MSKFDELLSLCDDIIEYLEQERQMYEARLEHYPKEIAGADEIKGGLQAIESFLCIMKFNRQNIAERRDRYEQSRYYEYKPEHKKVEKWFEVKR